MITSDTCVDNTVCVRVCVCFFFYGRWRSFLFALVYNSWHVEEEKDGVEDEEVPVTSHESDS